MSGIWFLSIAINKYFVWLKETIVESWTVDWAAIEKNQFFPNRSQLIYLKFPFHKQTEHSFLPFEEANSVETALRICNLLTDLFISYKSINWFQFHWLKVYELFASKVNLCYYVQNFVLDKPIFTHCCCKLLCTVQTENLQFIYRGL